MDHSQERIQQTAIQIIENQVTQQKQQEVKNAVVRDVAGNVDAVQSATNLKTKVNQIAAEADQTRTTILAVQSIDGRPNDQGSSRNKLLITSATVKEVLSQLKQNKNTVLPQVVAPGTNGGRVLNKLVDKIENPNTEISNFASPFIHKIIYQSINNPNTNPLQILSQEEIAYLRSSGESILLKKVAEALIEAARGDATISANEINEFKEKVKLADEVKNITVGDEEFEQIWRQTYNNYFADVGNNKKLVKAIYSVQVFKDLVKEYSTNERAKVRQLNPGISEEEENKRVGKAVSRQLETDFVLLYENFYNRLAEQKATEFFEEIVKQDFYKGIETTTIEFERRISIMANFLQEENIDLGMDFFKRMEQPPKFEEVKFGERTKTTRRVSPLASPRKTESSDFLHYLSYLMDNYRYTREFTHNTRAIYLQPPGKEGFYAQLKGYSERWSMADLDQLFLLPDNELFMDASRLYDKFVEEQFAKNDWKHTPDMFSPEPGSNFTRMENKTLKALQKLYPDIHDERRFKNALSIAIGMSRGIFLPEVEKAASADPDLKPDGTPKFTSYYTKDPNALIPLNPQHWFSRWQTEGALSNIFFMPLDKPYGVHDHNILWQKMKAYKDTWLQGKQTLGGSTLFIDKLMNICNIGGLIQRGSWRLENSYSYYLQYINREKSELNYLDSWKALENIGYEVVYNFADKYLFPDQAMMKTGIDSTKDTIMAGKKQVFFQHIFDKYFDDINGVTNLNDYTKTLRASVKETVYNNYVRDRKAPPLDGEPSVEELIEYEASKLFLFKGMARMINQRMPTKYLRMDRDRFADDGISSWRQAINDATLGLNSGDELDKVASNLELVESIKRREVSKAMRVGIDQAQQMHQIATQYKIDEAYIEAKLQASIPDSDGTKADQISKAKKLFRYLNSQGEFSGNGVKIKALDMLEAAVKPPKIRAPFTLAFDELDQSFLRFSEGGPNVLSRVLGDISAMEQSVITPLMKFHELLHNVAISGKPDFGEIVKYIGSVKSTIQGIISADYGQEVATQLAALTITYFKRDDVARVLGGALSVNRLNSMAAEVAGRSTSVWEWDSLTIDKFNVALENAKILPREPYDLSKPPKMQPVYIKVPFTKDKIIKTPFKRRKEDYFWTSDKLRDRFGANGKDILFDIIHKYGPMTLAIIFLFWLKKSFEEAFAKKK